MTMWLGALAGIVAHAERPREIPHSHFLHRNPSFPTATAARRSSMPLLAKARSRTADRGRTLTGGTPGDRERLPGRVREAGQGRAAGRRCGHHHVRPAPAPRPAPGEAAAQPGRPDPPHAGGHPLARRRPGPGDWAERGARGPAPRHVLPGHRPPAGQGERLRREPQVHRQPGARNHGSPRRGSHPEPPPHRGTRRQEPVRRRQRRRPGPARRRPAAPADGPLADRGK